MDHSEKKNKIKHDKELTEMNKVAKLSKGTETFFFTYLTYSNFFSCKSL